MKKNKLIKLIALSFAFLVTFTSVNAYNAKFAFNLKSGMLSPWSYSSYAYKATNNEAPVVMVTYTEGATSNFTYTVRNSDNQDRVNPFTRSGTFNTRAFQNSFLTKDYKYRLGIKRDGGGWTQSAVTHGLWNPDSY